MKVSDSCLEELKLAI